MVEDLIQHVLNSEKRIVHIKKNLSTIFPGEVTKLGVVSHKHYNFKKKSK